MSKEIPLHNGKMSIVDDEDYDYLMRWKWHCDNYNSVVRHTTGLHGKQRTIFMHRVIMNPAEDMEVDHINHNRLDNRRVNLRICTHSQNCINRPLRSDNKSGRRGVFWHKSMNKWYATICINGEINFIGYFDNKEDAYNAYKVKAKKLFGEFISFD